MIKNHCDICDAVIENNEPRVRFKKYPHEMQNEGCRPPKPCVDVTICENCLSHYTLADIVKRFGGTDIGGTDVPRLPIQEINE